MGISIFKKALGGMLVVGFASFLFADAIVDKEFDDNQNEFEYYWYYYDDNAGIGANDRPQKDPKGTPSVIQVPYTEKNREWRGDKSDTWKVKNYKFVTGEHKGKKCAIAPYKLGDPWAASYCSSGKKCAMPYIGIGTMLCRDSASIDLTGVEAVCFYVKSAKNSLNMVVKVEILPINKFSNNHNIGDEYNNGEFGYHEYSFTVAPDDWTLVEAPISQFRVPSWVTSTMLQKNQIKATLTDHLKEATKLAWELKVGDEEELKQIKEDTIFIADVYFTGKYTFVSPTVWNKYENSLPKSPMGAFATFDKYPYNGSPLGTYWYAYNDVEIGGNSQVSSEYATTTETGRLDIKFKEKTGSDGNGRGAALEFILGDPVKKNDSITILGFVGIGCNLYDSAAATYFDATEKEVNSIYFEYYTDGDIKYLTFELSDINDVGDSKNPDRRDSRGSGIVYYRNFLPTKGEWKRVLLPFDSLVIHSDWEGYKPIPLDKKHLAKIQWKVQGPKGKSGLFAIDNICFPGWAELGDVGVLKGQTLAKSNNNGLYAVVKNGIVNVKWNTPLTITSGRISFVNSLGAVVDGMNISNNNGIADFKASQLGAGLYFVRLNGRDASGKSVIMQLPINIVK